MIRHKKTISGNLMEADYYPIFDDGRKIPTRAPKTKPSTAAQEKYNQAKARKKLIRLVNTNFDSTDYFMHPTYSDGNSPQTQKQAQRDMINFLRRVKTRRAVELKECKSELLELKAIESGGIFVERRIGELKQKIKKLAEPLKYIYVIEKDVRKTGRRQGFYEYHFHLFISGGLDEKVMRTLWRHGLRANCRYYLPEEFGPESAATYLSKDPQGRKRFCYSKSLKQPKVSKPADGKVSRAYVEKLAKERCDDKEFWERKFKGYRFIKCVARWNEYNRNWYVTAIMYRDTSIPLPNFKPEAFESWLDDVC